MAPARLNTRQLDPIYVGSTWRQPVQFLNEDQSPRDLTGQTVRMAMQRRGLPEADIPVVGVDQGEGVVFFEADEAVTADWTPGVYSFEVQIEADDDVLSVLVGEVQIAQGAAAGGIAVLGSVSRSGVPAVVVSETGTVQVVFVDRVTVAATIDDIPGLRDLLTDYEERIAALEAGEPPASGGALDFSNPINSSLIGAL